MYVREPLGLIAVSKYPVSRMRNFYAIDIYDLQLSDKINSITL